jgi:hypothetical protein
VRTFFPKGQAGSANAPIQRVAQQTLYRLDYSRVSGLYRMVDGFAPEVSGSPRSSARILSRAQTRCQIMQHVSTRSR